MCIIDSIWCSCGQVNQPTGVQPQVLAIISRIHLPTFHYIDHMAKSKSICLETSEGYLRYVPRYAIMDVVPPRTRWDLPALVLDTGEVVLLSAEEEMGWGYIVEFAFYGGR